MSRLLSLIIMYVLLQSAASAYDKPANGALIFTEHGSSLVSTYTKSSFSHVAIVLYERGMPIVFEAKPGGVTKSTYGNYLKTAKVAKIIDTDEVTLWLTNPRQPYSEIEIRKMLNMANAKLGTRYSIIPTLTAWDQPTLQCAQYVSIVLQTGPRFWFRSPKSQTPTTLLRIAKPGYQPMQLVHQEETSNTSFFSRIGHYSE
ncbi:MAG: hypothetical protein CMJ76_11360 [Planctomycetaceae bacterium]|nr:hypothetical protein [Planctomycetaceae bacterium]